MSFFFSPFSPSLMQPAFPFAQAYSYPSRPYRRQASLTDLFDSFDSFHPFYSPASPYKRIRPSYVYVNPYADEDDDCCTYNSKQCCGNPNKCVSACNLNQSMNNSKKEIEDEKIPIPVKTNTSQKKKRTNKLQKQKSFNNKINDQKKEVEELKESTLSSSSHNISQEPLLVETSADELASLSKRKSKYASSDDDDSDALEWEEIDADSVHEHASNKDELKDNTTEVKEKEIVDLTNENKDKKNEMNDENDTNKLQTESNTNTNANTNTNETIPSDSTSTGIPITISTSPAPAVQSQSQPSKMNISIIRQIPLSMSLDIDESTTAYTITATIPHVTKEQISLQFDDGILSISASKANTNENKSNENQLYTIETRYSPIQRALRLPNDIDVENISAKHDNNQLIITLPKLASAQPKRIMIN